VLQLELAGNVARRRGEEIGGHLALDPLERDDLIGRNRCRESWVGHLAVVPAP
jgi:hypothetical protein